MILERCKTMLSVILPWTHEYELLRDHPVLIRCRYKEHPKGMEGNILVIKVSDEAIREMWDAVDETVIFESTSADGIMMRAGVCLVNPLYVGITMPKTNYKLLLSDNRILCLIDPYDIVDRLQVCGCPKCIDTLKGLEETGVPFVECNVVIDHSTEVRNDDNNE